MLEKMEKKSDFERLVIINDRLVNGGGEWKKRKYK